jgi:FkbM family methyltransferase
VSRLHTIARKLRLIARSELVGIDKIRYILNESNASGDGAGLVTYRLRGGARHAATAVALRKGTTDSKVFDEIFVERAYAPCVAGLPANLGMVTLIDLGANIGLSVLFLARALKVIEIIAVEPDPDNFRMLSENLRRAGLANRSIALRAFAGVETACAELLDPGNGAWGKRMGVLADTGIPVLPLAEIASTAKTNTTLVLKCDIEGGEQQLFLHIRDWEDLICYVFLELHTEFLSVDQLLACLDSSSFRWTVHGTQPPAASIALLLLERGDQKD